MAIALSQTAQDLVDLGIPTLVATIVGAILGAVLTYRFGKRLLDDQADRERERLIVQTERDAMTTADDALHRLRRVAERGITDPDWGALHSAWLDSVVGSSGRLRDGELRERIISVGWMIITASNHRDETPGWLVLEAIGNARDGLQAKLRGDPLPPSRFPSPQEAFNLMWGDGGVDRDARGDLEPLVKFVTGAYQADG